MARTLCHRGYEVILTGRGAGTRALLPGVIASDILLGVQDRGERDLTFRQARADDAGRVPGQQAG